MKFKLEGGASIELLTKDEVADVLKAQQESWRHELGRGVKWRTFSATTDAVAGVWEISANTDDNRRGAMGPEAGFIWSVTSVMVSGNGFDASSDNYSMFINDLNPSKLVWDASISGLLFTAAPAQLVLNNTDRLALSGAGTKAGGTQIVISGRCIELPAALSWLLL